MLARQPITPISDRDIPVDDILARLDEIERLLRDAVALAQTSCRVCQQALTTTAVLRSQIALRRRETQASQHVDHQPQGSVKPRIVIGCGALGDGPTQPLTPREREVLDLIAAGYSNRRIADTLFLSPRTVERHIANVYLKLNVHSRADAITYAVREHLA